MKKSLSRRNMLRLAGLGAGLASFSGIADGFFRKALGAPTNRQKAKNVIWLFMNGGPSAIDTFDHKPELKKWNGKTFSTDVKTLFPFPGPLMTSPYKFNRFGESGLEVSSIFPHVAKHADELCVVKSCTSTQLNHVPACYMMNTGDSRVGHPTLGAFMNYGLGTENSELPGFVVMMDRRSAPEGGANLWNSGFLPPMFQGVPMRNTKEPVMFLNSSKHKERQKNQLELLSKLNSVHSASHQTPAILTSRSKTFETASRMQDTFPKLLDISTESAATQKLYGLDDRHCQHFGNQCLLARRMVEQGVRFQQIFHGGWTFNWDSHTSLKENHQELAREVDKPISGLLADLKQRGLLETTLVIWGGEFGRLPVSQDVNGRDHNPYGFTMWMAGGGVKNGFVYGSTDEFGYQAVVDPVTVHDIHATIMHLMGIDHEKVSFRFNGRDQTMTNGQGHVLRELCA